MASHAAAADEVAIELLPFIRLYKSGRVERLINNGTVPASLHDAATGVSSKDVAIDPGTGVSVRLYLPPAAGAGAKLPIVVYFHGGGFMVESADSVPYHRYLNALAARASAVAVSVDYRRVPEHRLPAAYDDCWTALQWTASARDDWLAEHGDASRVFVAGDSAGGNIVHNVLVRASSAENAARIEGAVLLHPFFGGRTAIEGEPERAIVITAKVWASACPDAADGADDPRINPTAPALERLGCERMLVCAAEKDWLVARDRAYYDAVAASAWPGSAAWLETEGEEHVFFLLKPECDRAKALMDRVVAFIAGA